ncbi:hypothetical protein Avbf_01968 [Armadillidium vulgare]|nr:hypothetical protein Avbf_01968 [Armadillidium vulgare]
MEFNSTKPVEECDLSSETAFFWYRQTIDASPSLNEFGGCVLHCIVSILDSDHLLRSSHYVEGSRCWLGSHVHSGLT